MWERRIENMNWKSLSKWREEYDGLAQTFEIAERPITSFSPNNFFTIFFSLRLVFNRMVNPIAEIAAMPTEMSLMTFNCCSVS